MLQTIETADLVRYPIGKFTPPASLSPEERLVHIQTIRQFPEKMAAIAAQAGEAALENTYREGGWTLRQLIHHCADSHMNGYVRFRWALTEDSPTIKLYDQNGWASLPDAVAAPVDASLLMARGVHARWVLLLERLSEPDWNRTFHRADRDYTLPLWEAIAHYAWHCEHHLAHMRACLKE